MYFLKFLCLFILAISRPTPTMLPIPLCCPMYLTVHHCLLSCWSWPLTFFVNYVVVLHPVPPEVSCGDLLLALSLTYFPLYLASHNAELFAGSLLGWHSEFDLCDWCFVLVPHHVLRLVFVQSQPSNRMDLHTSTALLHRNWFNPWCVYKPLNKTFRCVCFNMTLWHISVWHYWRLLDFRLSQSYSLAYPWDTSTLQNIYAPVPQYLPSYLHLPVHALAASNKEYSRVSRPCSCM